MPFCIKCGAQIQDSAKFCSSCGNPISSPENESPERKVPKKKSFSDFLNTNISFRKRTLLTDDDKKKQTKKTVIGFIGMIILAIFTYQISKSDSDNKPKSAAETRQERIDHGFSAWDGSHIALTRMIKESMNDPKSFEHVETKYSDMKDHQARNGGGGKPQ